MERPKDGLGYGLTGLRYCFYIWCIFDNPEPIFTLIEVSLRKSWLKEYQQDLRNAATYSTFLTINSDIYTTSSAFT